GPARRPARRTTLSHRVTSLGIRSRAMRVFPVRGKEMAVHAKRFFARRRVIHRSCGEQTRRALLASMNNSGGTISLRVGSGWLRGAYRLAPRWPEGGFGVAGPVSRNGPPKRRRASLWGWGGDAGAGHFGDIGPAVMGTFCKYHDPGLGNPKSEARNPKQIQIPNRPMFKTSRRSVVLVIPLLVLGICFGLRISIFGFESPALGGAVQIRSAGTPRQRAESSQRTQNPICAPEAGWPPAVPEGEK